MIIIIMGVSGSGKSTVGRLLADRLRWPFHDGDELHPPKNVDKMASGQPLDDDDRWPWLERIGVIMRKCTDGNGSAVIACSALREDYRRFLREQSGSVKFVYLRGSLDTILRRMKARQNHFMPAGLLDSQFAALEEPQQAITVDIEQALDDIVASIVRRLSLADSG